MASKWQQVYILFPFDSTIASSLQIIFKLLYNLPEIIPKISVENVVPFILRYLSLVSEVNKDDISLVFGI